MSSNSSFDNAKKEDVDDLKALMKKVGYDVPGGDSVNEDATVNIPYNRPKKNDEPTTT